MSSPNKRSFSEIDDALDDQSLLPIFPQDNMNPHNQDLTKRSKQTWTPTPPLAPAQKWSPVFPLPALSAPLETMPFYRAQLLLNMRIASLLIIDVRTSASPTSSTGNSFIHPSLAIPAEGFYQSCAMLYAMAYASGMEWVVFTDETYASAEESGHEAQTGEVPEGKQRAGICAGWFVEFARGAARDNDMQVLVLEGGVEQWARGGEGFRRFLIGT